MENMGVVLMNGADSFPPNKAGAAFRVLIAAFPCTISALPLLIHFERYHIEHELLMPQIEFLK